MTYLKLMFEHGVGKSWLALIGFEVCQIFKVNLLNSSVTKRVLAYGNHFFISMVDDY